MTRTESNIMCPIQIAVSPHDYAQIERVAQHCYGGSLADLDERQALGLVSAYLRALSDNRGIDYNEHRSITDTVRTVVGRDDHRMQPEIQLIIDEFDTTSDTDRQAVTSAVPAVVSLEDTTQPDVQPTMDEIGTGTPDLAVDKALRQAYESLVTAACLVATSNGERAARVIGAQFDTALSTVETLLELRAGDLARTAARFGGERR